MKSAQRLALGGTLAALLSMAFLGGTAAAHRPASTLQHRPSLTDCAAPSSCAAAERERTGSMRRCGWMHGRDNWKAKISATHMRCRKARRILRYWFEEGPGVHYHPENSEWWNLDRYPGWRCGFGAGGGGCSKGRSYAGYQSLF